MKTIALWCMLLLVVGLPFYLLYWQVFRPVLMTRLKYKLFEARDALRLLAMEPYKSGRLKSYPVMERLCNQGIRRIDRLDLADLILCRPTKQEELEVKRDLSLIEEAGPEVRRLFPEVQSVMIGAVLANSPGVLALLMPFGFLAVVAYWFTRVRGAAAAAVNRIGEVIYLEPAAA